MIKIGDTVRVTDNGEVYTTYDDMAFELGATNWNRGVDPIEGCIGEVMNVGDRGHILVRIEGHEYIIGKHGLESAGKYLEGIEIGDIVEVVNSGRVYSTYHNMAKKLGATNWEGHSVRKGFKGKVIGIGEHHQDHGKMVALIEVKDGSQFLIGTRGIVVIKRGYFEEEWNDILNIL